MSPVTLRDELTPRARVGIGADPDCNYVGNDILSCFPLANTTLVEDVWSKFVWNAQLPSFIGAGSVSHLHPQPTLSLTELGAPRFLDVYLYHADSETVAKKYSAVPNAQIGRASCRERVS